MIDISELFKAKPEDYGLASTERNHQIVNFLVAGVDAVILNDHGDVVRITEILRSRGLGVVVVNLPQIQSMEDILGLTGIQKLPYMFDVTQYPPGSRLLVRGVDEFIKQNVDELRPFGGVDLFFQPLQLARKRSKGTFVTYNGDNLAEKAVYEIAAQRTGFINNFLLDHSPLTGIK